MEIHFDKDMRICGCKISQCTDYSARFHVTHLTDLLEKSRIVYQAQNERNFHIFYQLCFGATDEEKGTPGFTQLRMAESYSLSTLDAQGAL